MTKKYARVDYFQHARDQMRRRNISAKQVEKTLQEPHRLTQQMDGRWKAERDTTAGNFIRVVYIETPTGPSVITATVVTAIRITP